MEGLYIETGFISMFEGIGRQLIQPDGQTDI